MEPKQTEAELNAELDELKRKSAELIAQAAAINERIESLSRKVTPPTRDPSITDTLPG